MNRVEGIICFFEGKDIPPIAPVLRSIMGELKLPSGSFNSNQHGMTCRGEADDSCCSINDHVRKHVLAFLLLCRRRRRGRWGRYFLLLRLLLHCRRRRRRWGRRRRWSLHCRRRGRRGSRFALHRLLKAATATQYHADKGNEYYQSNESLFHTTPSFLDVFADPASSAAIFNHVYHICARAYSFFC